MTDEEYAVSVGNVGERDHNRIVLPGVDVTIPLELDADGDPLQDDEVRLRSRDGAFERVLLSSDADVTRDEEARLAFYCFRGVAFGRYDVSTRVGGGWVDVVTNLFVMRSGVFGPGGEIDASPPDPPSPPEERPDPPPLEAEPPTYLEQVPDADDPELY